MDISDWERFELRTRLSFRVRSSPEMTEFFLRLLLLKSLIGDFMSKRQLDSSGTVIDLVTLLLDEVQVLNAKRSAKRARPLSESNTQRLNHCQHAALALTNLRRLGMNEDVSIEKILTFIEERRKEYLDLDPGPKEGL